MAPLYTHTDPLETWALKSLRGAGYDVNRILRVYQPKHPDDGDYAEVLWIEQPGKACTTYMNPSGRIVVTMTGFG